jgi:hypothetical protein
MERAVKGQAGAGPARAEDPGPYARSAKGPQSRSQDASCYAIGGRPQGSPPGRLWPHCAPGAEAALFSLPGTSPLGRPLKERAERLLERSAQFSKSSAKAGHWCRARRIERIHPDRGAHAGDVLPTLTATRRRGCWRRPQEPEPRALAIGNTGRVNRSRVGPVHRWLPRAIAVLAPVFPLSGGSLGRGIPPRSRRARARRGGEAGLSCRRC